MLMLTLVLVLAASTSGEPLTNNERKLDRLNTLHSPNSMRLRQKCNNLRKTTANWQDVYWQCIGLNNNITSPPTANQIRGVRQSMGIALSVSPRNKNLTYNEKDSVKWNPTYHRTRGTNLSHKDKKGRRTMEMKLSVAPTHDIIYDAKEQMGWNSTRRVSKAIKLREKCHYLGGNMTSWQEAYMECNKISQQQVTRKNKNTGQSQKIKLSVTSAQNVTRGDKRPEKLSYTCPSNFIKLRHKCYYFSRKMATWQDAYWECRNLKSNLAIIRNANQDKLVKRVLLKKSSEPFERWLGGVYDWQQMNWKWAASGKPVVYQGFSRIESDKEKLRWHCITVDPTMQFKWNSKSCLESKHFICHTKIKAANKGKKNKQRQKNIKKYNQLNEIPVPNVARNNYNFTDLKTHQPNDINLDISNDLNAEFALKPAEKRKRRVKHQRRIQHIHSNGTVTYEIPPEVFENRRRRYRYRNEKEGVAFANPNHIRWRTYVKEDESHPLHPKAIVEEYNFVKE